MNAIQRDTNFARLISALEDGVTYGDKPVYFSMRNWFVVLGNRKGRIKPSVELTDHVENFNECGSAACLAGFIRILRGEDPEKNSLEFDYAREQSFLGIGSVSRAKELFIPWMTKHYSGKSSVQFTRERAIKTLKHLWKTGEVKWEVD